MWYMILFVFMNLIGTILGYRLRIKSIKRNQYNQKITNEVHSKTFLVYIRSFDKSIVGTYDEELLQCLEQMGFSIRKILTMEDDLLIRDSKLPSMMTNEVLIKGTVYKKSAMSFMSWSNERRVGFCVYDHTGRQMAIADFWYRRGFGSGYNEVLRNNIKGLLHEVGEYLLKEKESSVHPSGG